MNNALSPIFLMPAVMCISGIIYHALLAKRPRTHRNFMWLLVIALLTCIADDIIGKVYGQYALSVLLMQLCALSLLPVAAMYLIHLKPGYVHKPQYMLWIIIPASLFCCSFILTNMMGLERTNLFLTNLYKYGHRDPLLFPSSLERIYYLCSVEFYRIALLSELLFFYGLCIYNWISENLSLKVLRDYFRHKGRVRVLELQIIIIALSATVVVLKSALQEIVPYATADWVPAILSAIFGVNVAWASFWALFSSKMDVSREEAYSAFRYNYSSVDKNEVIQQMILDMAGELDAPSLSKVLAKLGTQGDIDTLHASTKVPGAPQLASAIFNAVSKSWDDGSLVSRFQHLMIDEQAFLMPGLTLADVADRLHTNKTYISKMVNKTYNLGFPELLNILRIDYAEQFIPLHEDFTQEEIAKACGFVSAPSFNTTFKRITGYTPKVWVAKKTL